MKPQMSPCPECGKEPEPGHMPPEDVDPGGMYPCWSCGAVRVFDGEGALREPTDKERAFIDGNPQVFYMRRFAAMRRSFASWCAAEGVAEPGSDDVLRFILSGGLAPPEPVSRPAWAGQPSVLIAHQAGAAPGEGNFLLILRRPSEPEGPGSAEAILTAEEFGELTRQVTATEREMIAVALEAMIANYPEDIFIPGSGSPDSMAAAAMRHAYATAADIVREARYRQ